MAPIHPAPDGSPRPRPISPTDDLSRPPAGSAAPNHHDGPCPADVAPGARGHGAAPAGGLPIDTAPGALRDALLDEVLKLLQREFQAQTRRAGLDPTKPVPLGAVGLHFLVGMLELTGLTDLASELRRQARHVERLEAAATFCGILARDPVATDLSDGLLAAEDVARALERAAVVLRGGMRAAASADDHARACRIVTAARLDALRLLDVDSVGLARTAAARPESGPTAGRSDVFGAARALGGSSSPNGGRS